MATRLGWSRPIGLLQRATLHHVADETNPRALMARYVDALPRDPMWVSRTGGIRTITIGRTAQPTLSLTPLTLADATIAASIESPAAALVADIRRSCEPRIRGPLTSPSLFWWGQQQVWPVQSSA